MRDPNRIEKTIETLKKAWENNPDLRLTQLLLNMMPNDKMAYYVEDDIIEKALHEYYNI